MMGEGGDTRWGKKRPTPPQDDIDEEDDGPMRMWWKMPGGEEGTEWF
jgi:hypothetical protein